MSNISVGLLIQTAVAPRPAAPLLLPPLHLFQQFSSSYFCRALKLFLQLYPAISAVHPNSTLTCAPAASSPPAVSAVRPGVLRGGAAPSRPGQKQQPPPAQPAAANTYNLRLNQCEFPYGVSMRKPWNFQAWVNMHSVNTCAAATATAVSTTRPELGQREHRWQLHAE